MHGGCLTFSKIVTRVKQDVSSSWKQPPVHEWYEGNHPGAALLGTAVARLKLLLLLLSQAKQHQVNLVTAVPSKAAPGQSCYCCPKQSSTRSILLLLSQAKQHQVNLATAVPSKAAPGQSCYCCPKQSSTRSILLLLSQAKQHQVNLATAVPSKAAPGQSCYCHPKQSSTRMVSFIPLMYGGLLPRGTDILFDSLGFVVDILELNGMWRVLKFNCKVTQATTANILACIGCHNSQILSSPTSSSMFKNARVPWT
ncbi:hypothetical protein TNCV_4859571 [Trichonephila clavipes]|nr:hypothetical protein TNCV_4859571 [Trichonephila clavipes]